MVLLALLCYPRLPWPVQPISEFGTQLHVQFSWCSDLDSVSKLNSFHWPKPFPLQFSILVNRIFHSINQARSLRVKFDSPSSFSISKQSPSPLNSVPDFYLEALFFSLFPNILAYINENKTESGNVSGMAKCRCVLKQKFVPICVAFILVCWLHSQADFSTGQPLANWTFAILTKINK